MEKSDLHCPTLPIPPYMMGDREAADLDELAEHNPDRFEGEETADNTVEEMLGVPSTPELERAVVFIV